MRYDGCTLTRDIVELDGLACMIILFAYRSLRDRRNRGDSVMAPCPDECLRDTDSELILELKRSDTPSYYGATLFHHLFSNALSLLMDSYRQGVDD